MQCGEILGLGAHDPVSEFHGDYHRLRQFADAWRCFASSGGPSPGLPAGVSITLV